MSDMVEAGLTKLLATRDLQVRVVGSSSACPAGKTGGLLCSCGTSWAVCCKSDMVEAGSPRCWPHAACR
jgi:hypothetical protein